MAEGRGLRQGVAARCEGVRVLLDRRSTDLGEDRGRIVDRLTIAADHRLPDRPIPVRRVLADRTAVMADAGLEERFDGIAPGADRIDGQQGEQRLQKGVLAEQLDGLKPMSGRAWPSLGSFTIRPALGLESAVGLAEVVQEHQYGKPRNVPGSQGAACRILEGASDGSATTEADETGRDVGQMVDERMPGNGPTAFILLKFSERSEKTVGMIWSLVVLRFHGQEPSSPSPMRFGSIACAEAAILRLLSFASVLYRQYHPDMGTGPLRRVRPPRSGSTRPGQPRSGSAEGQVALEASTPV